MLQYLYIRHYLDSSDHDSIDIKVHVKKKPIATDGQTAGEGNFDEVQLVKAADGVLNMCWLHSAMYTLGDRYQVPGLKTCSFKKFKQTCRANPRQAISTEVIRQVYDGTPETDRHLRSFLVGTFCRLIATSREEIDITNALESSHPFAKDLALSLSRQSNQEPADM